MESKARVTGTIDKPLEQYIRDKIKMLQRHFFIDLTAAEIDKMKRCKSEIAVDNYAISILSSHL